MRHLISTSLLGLLVAGAFCGMGCLTNHPDEGNSTNGDVEMATDNTDQQDSPRGLDVQQEPFGTLNDGVSVERFLLSNDNDMLVSIITYGAVVTSVEVPDKAGHVENVTLGFATLDGYADLENTDPYFGAIVGRYANRIALGKFTIDGEVYTLATNNSPNHLHGGTIGYNDVVWQARELDTGDDNSVAVELTYLSLDGDENYPGELKVTVVYTLNNDNELRIDYTAFSDKATPINLTNHCYWNLAGTAGSQATGDILEHTLMLNCDRYLPVDETLIPTGELKPVADTPMDFTTPAAIGSRFAAVKGESPTGGYDHCFVIESWDETLRLAARVSDPKSGRVMEILTTEPGIQLYTGNFLDGKTADGGFGRHTAFCLECQHFPDSPNRPNFPNTIYGPGEVYKQTTVHRFSVEK
jgi:aldose 1-epimerase